MASPFVAGQVALMLQQSPGLSPAEVYADLTQTGRDFGIEGPDTEYGHGLLDGYAALRPTAGMGSNNPSFPANMIGSGAITAAARTTTHTFEVASTKYPIAITLVIGNWSRFNTDLDAELWDPEDRRVALSESTTRQETLVWRPQQAGTYTLRVYGYRTQDRGAYSFDVSADLAGTRDAATLP
jgi:serine protease AprX